MRITYDGVADAAYIYLAEKTEPPETRVFDDEIYLDFDAQDRLVGIEVLDASRRLPLPALEPVLERIDEEWARLTEELQHRKDAGQYIEVSEDAATYRVEEVGYTYTVLRDDASKETTKVTARALLGPGVAAPLLRTLREIGGYSERKGVRP